MTEREALMLALKALQSDDYWTHVEAVNAIHKVLAQPEQEPKCNPHPKAPHGFNRNASHANGRYTCECESWDAYEAGRLDGIAQEQAMYEVQRLGQEIQPEQEPVATMPSNTRYTVEVEGHGRTYWDNIHDAITNAQRAVYAGPDNTTRALDDLKAGRIAEWSYGFSAVRIYPPQPKEPEQEPVAWMKDVGHGIYVDMVKPVGGFYGMCRPLVFGDTTPPQRTWVGLTDDDLRQIILVAAGVAEAKLKEKNA